MDIREDFLNFFCLVLNEIPNSLIEISNTPRGFPSQWNMARYYRSITYQILDDLLRTPVNFGYLNGIADLPIFEGKQTRRCAKDNHVNSKNLMVFDCDFKTCIANYQQKSPDELAGIAFRLSDKIFSAFKAMKLTPYYFMFSGHGLHAATYISPPKFFEVKENFSNFYLMAAHEIEERVPKLSLDKACSNPARIFRLPFSTNFKDNQEPTATQVLYYDKPVRFHYL